MRNALLQHWTDSAVQQAARPQATSLFLVCHSDLLYQTWLPEVFLLCDVDVTNKWCTFGGGMSILCLGNRVQGEERPRQAWAHFGAEIQSLGLQSFWLLRQLSVRDIWQAIYAIRASEKTRVERISKGHLVHSFVRRRSLIISMQFLREVTSSLPL